MRKTLAFAASNSSNSINHQLINYFATLTDELNVIKLTDYEAPMYNMDTELESGIPINIKTLSDEIAQAGQLIISVAEHNGNVSAFFKNTIDWLSRNNNQFLKDKEVILFSTSPGKRGASSALKITETMLPFFGATIKSTTSIGSFYDVFKEGKIVDEKVNNELKTVANNLK